MSQSEPNWDRIMKALESIAAALEESTFIKREYSEKMKRREKERAREPTEPTSVVPEGYFGVPLKPPIPMTDGTIKGFLQPRVLERMREKHGLEYKLRTSGEGLLWEVYLPKTIDPKLFEEIKGAIDWVCEKYSERQNQ